MGQVAHDWLEERETCVYDAEICFERAEELRYASVAREVGRHVVLFGVEDCAACRDSADAARGLALARYCGGSAWGLWGMRGVQGELERVWIKWGSREPYEIPNPKIAVNVIFFDSFILSPHSIGIGNATTKQSSVAPMTHRLI